MRIVKENSYINAPANATSKTQPSARTIRKNPFEMIKNVGCAVYGVYSLQQNPVERNEHSLHKKGEGEKKTSEIFTPPPLREFSLGYPASREIFYAHGGGPGNWKSFQYLREH